MIASPPEKVDVLVIGGGNAALCAAISAREQGASVVVLERAAEDMRGGNTRHVRNFRVAHERPTATLTDSYSEEEFWQDLLRVTEGNTREELARLTVRNSRALLTWYVDRGVYFQPSFRGALTLDRTNAFYLGGGCALLNTQYQRAKELGVQIFYNCDVRHLDIQNGKFTAAHYVQAQPQQGCQSQRLNCIQGRAVITACGGFQGNSEWMRRVWGPSADNFLIRGTPHNDGHILQNLLDCGVASIGEADQCHAVAIDARAPKYDGGIVSRVDSVCFGVVVNANGERFYDEGEDFWPKRYAIWGRLVAEQPEQIAYSIIDSKVVENFMPTVFPPVHAPDLGQLAQQLNVPTATLLDTVERFNRAVQPGTYNPQVLDACATHNLQPAKSNWALPIDTPPFYAYPLRPGITFTYLGVKVDETARVLMDDGTPSPNIFAAGEIMAGNILGKGYCAGTGMTIGGVFGCIAGQEAACLNNS